MIESNYIGTWLQRNLSSRLKCDFKEIQGQNNFQIKTIL
jgi:hypothetical protein